MLFDANGRSLIKISGLFFLPPLQSNFLCVSVDSSLIGGNLGLVPLNYIARPKEALEVEEEG